MLLEHTSVLPKDIMSCLCPQLTLMFCCEHCNEMHVFSPLFQFFYASESIIVTTQGDFRSLKSLEIAWPMINTEFRGNGKFYACFLSHGFRTCVQPTIVFSGKLNLHDYWNVITYGADKPAKHEITSHKDSVN